LSVIRIGDQNPPDSPQNTTEAGGDEGDIAGEGALSCWVLKDGLETAQQGQMLGWIQVEPVRQEAGRTKTRSCTR